MNDFWFTWVNGTTNAFQNWSFPDSGNYFELAPNSRRTEENQYDLGDRIRISIPGANRATLVLTGAGWQLDASPANVFQLSTDPVTSSVVLICTATN